MTQLAESFYIGHILNKSVIYRNIIIYNFYGDV